MAYAEKERALIESDIERCGRFLTASQPPFAYTIGNELKGWPELRNERKSEMFENRNAMQCELWAPYYAALEQIEDAIAAISLETQLEHHLMTPPQLWRDFDAVFRQRHPAVWEAFQAADGARNRAANAAWREEAKQRGIATRKLTMARKKAEREMAATRNSAHGKAG